MIKYCLILLFSLYALQNKAEDQLLKFKGQLSGWTHVNSTNTYPIYFGTRYIPQLNTTIVLKNSALLDFETSANTYGDIGINKHFSTSETGDIKPYRAWARYSNAQMEFRVGLQKINFGSATMLRPLMWFDQVDARDPLKLTDGVWGALGRYYFLNNANLWLWCLYGNYNTKGWELTPTHKNDPELGGRFQFPFKQGEGALSFHHRQTNTSSLDTFSPETESTSENRMGLDLRMDAIVGFWVESTWVTNSKKIGIMTNQLMANIGFDYTFGIGNGISITAEQLYASYDEEAFNFTNTISFSAISLNYPIGLFDNINTIVYYDWKNNASYNFINWQRTYDKLSINIIAYWNPDKYQIPTQQGTNLFTNRGIQLMLIYTH